MITKLAAYAVPMGATPSGSVVNTGMPSVPKQQINLAKSRFANLRQKGTDLVNRGKTYVQKGSDNFIKDVGFAKDKIVTNAKSMGTRVAAQAQTTANRVAHEAGILRSSYANGIARGKNVVSKAVPAVVAAPKVLPLAASQPIPVPKVTTGATTTAAGAAKKAGGMLSRMGRYGKIGAGVLAGAGLAYGGYKGYQKNQQRKQFQKVGEAIYKHQQLKKVAINGAVGAEYLSRMGALD